MSKRFNFILSGLTLLPFVQPALINKVSIASSAALIISSSQKVNANERYYFYFDRAAKKYDKGDLSGAIADYTKAINIDSQDANAFYNRALAKHESEDYSGAIADYTSAIEINPNDHDFYFNRGLSYIDSGYNKKAIKKIKLSIGCT